MDQLLSKKSLQDTAPRSVQSLLLHSLDNGLAETSDFATVSEKDLPWWWFTYLTRHSIWCWGSEQFVQDDNSAVILFAFIEKPQWLQVFSPVHSDLLFNFQ